MDDENAVSTRASEAALPARSRDPLTGRRRRARSREEMRAEIRRLHRRRLTLALAVAGLLAACVGLAAGLWRAQDRLDRLVPTLRHADVRLERLRGQLAASEAALEESRAAVDALVADRIPGLMALRWLEAIPVDLPLVRQLSFESTESGLECKLLLENDSEGVVAPRYGVSIFDEVGVELARGQIVDGTVTLREDEVRTFFATLALGAGDTPRYFRITSD